MKNLFRYIIPVFLVAFGILAFADNAESLSSDVADGALSVLSADDCTVYAEQANNFFLPSNNCISCGANAQQYVAKRVKSYSKFSSEYECFQKHDQIFAGNSFHYKFPIHSALFARSSNRLVVLGKLII